MIARVAVFVAVIVVAIVIWQHRHDLGSESSKETRVVIRRIEGVAQKPTMGPAQLVDKNR